MSVFLVPDALAGQRIDVVASRVTGHSRSRVAELIAAGGMLLDGETVKRASRIVTAGAMLELVTEPRPTQVASRPRLVGGLEIIHEDRDIVVVDKPAGVAAHPSLGWEGPSVTEHLAAAGIAIATSGAPERQGVVSRLDVGTSGLMVLARSERAYSVLKQAFRDKAVDKTYQALVQGHPDPFSGTIDAPIGRHPGHEWKMAIVGGGRESVTHYETLEAHRAATLVEVSLETGRTHQIRVHFAAIGHPCCGDPLYGSDPALAKRLGLDRQWLHATRLAFEHPVEGNRVEFKSELPRDLEHALREVRSD
ncbi:RluA family pseudouridine synthase [Arachnia propionica]|uniref:Pseudouridine synthase n=1 Tax=Arachnia propionica TaxID=1750 RepID=A0AB37HXL0_9ACTN|nr:RluA family pseudouridine synthase [Arachnia propionica]AFN46013.1 pseudouridine synthase, RluA family [Arachnia propionica F0230a]QCT38123.1 RluA family pseudouridine synthase [Arachnia propionica]QUC12294.1 RluA family pseudouridine synthase [Arachnia propionica]QUC13026.1 RluA family pseudouridine synthase [Arachnia propionica]RPA19093.1 RluA family pseudouridine synthase [Arachnia propionica]